MKLFIVSAMLVLPVALCGNSYKGPDGKDVHGCRCKGKEEGGAYGHCGFHKGNMFSSEDKPWCRTTNGCGEPGLLGSWMHCSPIGLERRRADDGKLYDAREFANHYSKAREDSKKKWLDATPYAERRKAENLKMYNVHEFRNYYIESLGEEGWLDKWTNADPEARQAEDGKWYTWEKFTEYFGKEKRWAKWHAAAPKNKEADGKGVSGCRCKGKGQQHGHCGFHINAFSSEDQPWCRTTKGCGESGVLGSWMYCSPIGLERRRADNGKLYNVREFAGTKDSKKEWLDAAPYVERRMARNLKTYNVHEFRKYYLESFGEEGWLDKWTNADPEERQADDGKWYTWEKFTEYYGQEKRWAKWQNAAPKIEL